MEFISNLAYILNFMFSGVNETFGILLNVNYTIVSNIVEICLSIWNLFKFLICTCVNGIVCALEDFSQFVQEIFEGIFVVIHFLWSLGEGFLDACASVVTLGRNLIISLLSFAFGIIFAIQDQFTAFFEVITHSLKLLCTSLVLLFQTIPNMLIHTIKISILSVFEIVLKFFSSISEVFHKINTTVANFDQKCRDAFFSIPIDAYMGLGIALLSFYVMKTGVNYVVQHGIFIPNFQVPQHLKSMINYIISLFSHLYQWLISWLFYENEQNESDDEESDDQGTENEHFEEHEQQQELEEQPLSNLNPSKRKSLSTIRLEESDDEDNDASLKVELERERERQLCVVCQDQLKSVILLPCRHFCLCQACRSAIIVLGSGCPICRRPILDYLHVFT
ncbi:uncharacterized protein LOC111086394 [Limulus polyphemus]|uniref:Uncharacterized protein LOC111086394 n=1 Tax=Limulus polyphemus TaxID=6850 RepID=A0ABM1SM89_LIMPO|nr:uncharacterized protein LOC111086394 [Limulus polyphemus]